jgi:3,4-dehydroadipyl-CoA semialdehyde dehydrogenase
VAFTGSGDTGQIIRSHPAMVRHNVRINVEADSLNGSVVGRDVEVGSDTFAMFVNDVLTDMTQKAGQKCTAVRRIFVPADRRAEIVEALVDRLQALVVGNPAEKGVEVGPLATPAQKADIERGVAALSAVAPAAWRAKAPEGGCFVAPGLFVAPSCDVAFVHEHEVFGPIATVLPYGSDAELFGAVAKGGGGLVCSLYTDDLAFAGAALLELAPWHGRIQWGSAKIFDQGAGPGTVLPNLVHGGPGKAGGGEELGGMRGLAFYTQRTAVQADRVLLQRLLEAHGHGHSDQPITNPKAV